MKNKKSKEKKDTKQIKAIDSRVIVGVCAAVLVLAVVLVAFIKGDKLSSKDDKNKDKDGQKEEVKSNEDTVEKEYGFSKEDAKSVVMERFQSDNYEATSVTVREDNMYVVVVTNTDNGSTYTYIVDPNTGEARQEME